MNTYMNFVGKPEGKRQLGRPKLRRVENIKMVLREIRWVGMDWIDMAQDRDQWMALVNTIMNRRFPKNVGNFLSSCTPSVFSRRSQLHGVTLVSHVWALQMVSSPCVLNLLFYF
jgi:hypothetical protein